MKRLITSIAFAMITLLSIPHQALAVQLLIPGGEIIGLELSNDAVIVAAFDDTLGSTARDAGLQIGDQILSIDNTEISCAEDVRTALKNCDGDVDITVLRGSKRQTLYLKPASTAEGPRLGVYLRQGIAGIGTVTWYDPESDLFGTLGHGVSDGKGSLLNLKEGSAYDASVVSVKKGKSGDPGQLRGNAETDDKVGTLLKNTPQGVFGISKEGWRGEALPVAAYEDIQTGPAIIRSTVVGDEVQEYSVEILKIYPQDRTDCRNFLIKVTDPDLLNTTGGIVQGMGVSYNKDNLEKPLACKGFWCQSLFLLTSKIACIKRGYTWAESSEVCDRDGWTKSSERSLST